MTQVLPRLVATLPADVHRASLPTPFRVGHVNCYLLAEPPVTLIDPGTLEAGSLDALAQLLRSRGLSFGDVEQIVITHAHPDHFGAAAVLAARSGARIITTAGEAAQLTGRRESRETWELLRTLGVPDAVAGGLTASGEAVLRRVVKWADVQALRTIADGETLRAGGREFVCVVSTGHADGHLSLWDPSERLLFSGDHLLPRIIPVPSLHPGAEATERRPFVAYLAGLSRFVDLEPATILPGHGGAFTDAEILASHVRSHSRARAADVATSLGTGSATPYELAHRLQWQPRGARLVFGLAHVQGHLDLLLDQDQLTTENEDGVLRYRRR